MTATARDSFAAYRKRAFEKWNCTYSVDDLLRTVGSTVADCQAVMVKDDVNGQRQYDEMFVEFCDVNKGLIPVDVTIFRKKCVDLALNPGFSASVLNFFGSVFDDSVQLTEKGFEKAADAGERLLEGGLKALEGTGDALKGAGEAGKQVGKFLPWILVAAVGFVVFSYAKGFSYKGPK